ncbi:MAG: type IV toxin-antitoxin system AbiEi family antitoxin domain-containing protein [Actinomycetota bacterium]|nr:type IV toxin-antitoxin system AbiEi family antitoxin domain-containing protein [Actinomycetota bacterium]
MPAFDQHVARWFHDHHGIASSPDLAALGLTERQRELLIAAGVLVPLFEGVYRLASSPLDFEARCTAVCAADASLVLSCYTGGSLFGLRQCRHAFIHATTTRLTKPVGPQVKIHRTRELPDAHVLRRADGIRLTIPERVFFDMAKHVDDLVLLSIGEQIMADGLASIESLAAVVAQLARPGRPGSARAMRVLARRSIAGKPADSHDEVVLLDALHRAGLTGFERHPAVRLLGGTVVHPDMGDPAVGFYVEVDHPSWHDGVRETDYDKSRDRQVRRTGAAVERVTSSQIRGQLSAAVDELRQLYLDRVAQLGGGATRWVV